MKKQHLVDNTFFCYALDIMFYRKSGIIDHFEPLPFHSDTIICIFEAIEHFLIKPSSLLHGISPDQLKCANNIINLYRFFIITKLHMMLSQYIRIFKKAVMAQSSEQRLSWPRESSGRRIKFIFPVYHSA